MDLERIRRETPACRGRIHLNNAGASLMPEPVVSALLEYLKLETRIGGYEAADFCREEIAQAYASIARLLGTESRNIAFTESATISYSQALSAVPFSAGDVLLTTRNDYVSNQIQFLSLAQRFGIEVVRAPDRPEGGVDVGAMEELIHSRQPRLVCLTQIPTSSGLVQDAAAVGKLCREAGVLYLVDACQSVGQMPVDVGELGCDFLSATSRKFLRGPRGAGFLYVSDRALEAGLTPLFVDLRGAVWEDEDRFVPLEDAHRFETWEFAWALVLATGAAARYALELGLQPIQDRVRSLADRLRRALGDLEGARVLDRGEELAGIVTIALESHDPGVLVRTLRDQGINTSSQHRAGAVFDFDGKGVTGALRLSPHYFNTEDEIDRAVVALHEAIT